MTRKDYIVIAAIIAGTRSQLESSTASNTSWNNGNEFARELIAYTFAEHAERNNPRFDRARFLKACGIDDA